MDDNHVGWTSPLDDRLISDEHGYYQPSQSEIINQTSHSWELGSVVGISQCKVCGQRVYGLRASYKIGPCVSTDRRDIERKKDKDHQ